MKRDFNRRSILAALAVSGSAGCLSGVTDTETTATGTDSSGPTRSTTASPTQSATAIETETGPSTATKSPTLKPAQVNCWDKTPEPTPTDSDSSFEPNATEYAAAWPLAPENAGNTLSLFDVIDGEESAVLLRTRDQWRRLRNSLTEATGESFEDYEFATQTTFETESILAFQTTVSDSQARIHLAAVTDVRTETPQLCTWDGNRGGNSTPTRLLLVRLPDGGEEAIRPVVAHRSSRTSEESETHVAEPYD